MDIAEYKKYGRQMIVPEIGLKGQLKLKNSAVLIIGAGGLGCPALAYLAGAGIGKIGIFDADKVDISNLHRQILYGGCVGQYKSIAAADFARKLNDKIVVEPFVDRFSADHIDIARNYDLILDCTDTPSSRYTINDIAVVLDKPVVSASALRGEGQLAVYHYQNGPCYRCLFPNPPPPETVTACSDGGIIGPVVGLMGVYQAIEAIKIIAIDTEYVPMLMLFSPFNNPPWKCVRIRNRQKNCIVCGDSPEITRQSINSVNYDTIQCTLVDPIDNQIDPNQVNDSMFIIDVRPAHQYEICSLPNSINIPLKDLERLTNLDLPAKPILTVCRFGNDSQKAVRILEKMGINAVDLRGGLSAWSDFDPEFPRY